MCDYHVKVSIIVPVFNAANYLPAFFQCIESQTLKEIEVIFVNDGSMDGSLRLLEEFARTHCNASVISQENQGPGIARNIGMKQAIGKYIAFWDVDDYFQNEMLEILFSIAQKFDADISVCAYRELWEDSGVIISNQVYMRKQDFAKYKDFVIPSQVADSLYQMFSNYVWHKLFRTSYLKRNNLCFADTVFNEDTTFVFPALSLANKIAFTHKELMTYRRNKGDSLCDNLSFYWKDNIRSLDVTRNSLKNHRVYDCFEKSWMKMFTRLFSLYFRVYRNQEAFLGIYYYLQETIKDRLHIMEESDFYEPEDYERWKEFVQAKSPLEFLLHLKQVKVLSPSKKFLKFHRFPYEEIRVDTKVILYGAGVVGRDLFLQIQQSEYGCLVAWVDTWPEKYQRKGYPVEAANVIFDREFDILVICMLNKSNADFVAKDLVQHGIPLKKIKKFSPWVNKDDLIKQAIEGSKKVDYD